VYSVANNRFLLKSLPLKGNWFKTDWFRIGNSVHSNFAGEQVIDELARAAKMDPVAFRIKNVTSGTKKNSLLDVLNAVTSAAKWQPRVSAVNKKTGKITVKHVYEAFTAGLSVYPDGVESQIVGGVVQIISRLLTEQLHYSKTNVTGGDFVSYPLLRFKDTPKVTLLQHKDVQPIGVGEPVTQVAAAAVANAFFDATGVRMRTTPFTPARVRAALKAAGVK
jgi:CO/xanthine dehydrogenase Mo-binding subunit